MFLTEILYEGKGVLQKLTRSYRGLAIAFVATLLAISLLIIFSTIPNSTTSVSALVANGVGVYRDGSCTETDRVSFIDWETLTPGSAKSYDVYIQNEGGEPMYLIKNATNWSPQDVPLYMALDWDYKGQRINPGDNLRITLTLKVSPYIKEISNFSFDIFITGRDKLMGDIDGDGDVDATDMIFYFSPAYGSQRGDKNYNPDADFDGNGIVDSIDLVIYFAPNYHITLSK
jgi:hypothetical protein